MKKLLVALFIVGLSVAVLAGKQDNVSITIYNNDLGLVKDVRTLNLKKGISMLDFTDVAAQIDPTSVNFRCLDNDKVAVYEQNFLYDLVSTDALLKRFLGLNIAVVGEDDRRYRGVLLSYDGRNIILRDDNNEVVMVASGKIVDYKFPSLKGLITKPTLRLQLSSPVAGPQKCEISYLTGGLKWQADYVAVVSQDDKRLNLSGWVTINNNSGATYEDALLKLVAGDVHRVSRSGRSGGARYDRAMMAKAAGVPQFKEESFFEYHLYTLSRPANLHDKEIKQLTLFPSAEVSAKKVYIFDAGGGYYNNGGDNTKIKVNLEFKNSQAAGLGIPLPKGKLWVYKEDSEKALQFIGEDFIDHTPKDEQVRVYLGNAFDITGSRKTTDRVDLGKGHYRESYEITLKNHKKEDIVVTVVEHPKVWREWTITKSSQDYRKVDNYKVEFDVSVAADSEARLTYTIQY